MKNINKKNNYLFLLISIFFVSCSHLKLEDIKKNYFKNDEFEKTVKIDTQEPEEAKPATHVSAEDNKKTQMSEEQTQTSVQDKNTPPHKKNTSQEKLSNHKVTKKTKSQVSSSKKESAKVVIEPKNKVREPELEDAVGFTNGSRLPDKIPFAVGEKVTHAVRYFAAEAGRLTLQVKPMAVVNNKEAYRFSMGLKSSRLFSSFYSVDDEVETFLDAQELLPYVLKITIKETNKFSQVQSFFDFTNLKAHFWEKKVTTKNGEEEKKSEYDILPFSQNAYSGLFYMRIFDWKVGKTISFRVAEDEKNIVFNGECLAKETLETDAGTFEAYKIQAHIVSRGALSQTGGVFIWISADEHKYVLRVEAKIKIGSIVSEAVEIVPGQTQKN